MSTPVIDIPARVERSAARRWGLLIVGLLVFQVGFGGVSVALALRGHSHDIVPDYYNKALHWDDRAHPQPASAPAHASENAP